MRVSLCLATTGLLMLASTAVALAAEDVDVSGKWSGVWSARRSSGACTLVLVQKGRNLSGEVQIADRPISPANYEAPVQGSVKGNGGELVWTPPAPGLNPYTVYVEFTLSVDGMMTGLGKGAGGVLTTFTLKRPQ